MNSEPDHKCLFCGFEFSLDQAESVCASCLLSSCNKMCCPNCGYEYLPEPKFIKYMRKRRNEKKKKVKT